MNDLLRDAEAEIVVVKCTKCNTTQTAIDIIGRSFLCVKCKHNDFRIVERIKNYLQVRVIPNGKVGSK